MAFTNVNKNGTVVLLHTMKANKGGWTYRFTHS